MPHLVLVVVRTSTFASAMTLTLYLSKRLNKITLLRGTANLFLEIRVCVYFFVHLSRTLTLTGVRQHLIWKQAHTTTRWSRVFHGCSVVLLLWFPQKRRENVCQSLNIEAPETSYADILQRLVRRYLFKMERLKMEGDSEYPLVEYLLHQASICLTKPWGTVNRSESQIFGTDGVRVFAP